MTKIVFRQNHRHFIATFSGHANAPRTGGNDLVCAAASMLAQTLMQGVMDESKRGNIQSVKHNCMNERDGAVSVEIVATDEGFPQVLGLFSGIASGCAMLANQYPDSVSVGREFQEYVKE
ncbi:MAG TPA: ribosomal-processing cysteine protease Prp [Candidatus Limiplasma sp.]|nr:ribosomal-processing cysteine protease Prp [Candidatus Limiplasma sp.]HPS80804.1 ribosomal-processing cysteine protease Prp [Candidatus Limiplasma sp.]